jgi:hypothetical protein
VCARVGGLVLRARPEPDTRNHASLCLTVWTACGFGAQAFNSASAFNANIGAWNTASVYNMQGVCAAPGPAARTMADALGRASMLRGPFCGYTVARARAHTCKHSLARGHGCGYGRPEGRVDTYIYMHVCMLVCYTFIHTLSIYLYM